MVVVFCAECFAGQLAQVELRPSDKPGYETEAVLKASDGSVLGTLDLLRGERIVRHSGSEVVFQRPDSTQFRFVAPFNGRPVPVGSAVSGSSPTNLNVADATAVVATVTAISKIASWLFGSDPLAVPPQASAPVVQPTPEPVPTPQSTPRPEDRPIWTVIVRGDRLVCMDARTGSTRSSINLSGEVLSGPVVTGEYCTLTVRSANGPQAKTYKLPSLSLQNSVSL
jgi:hypothetical protein